MRKGDPEKVQVHDFIDRELGKVNPYGVYDVGANSGWVSVGVSSDTAAFAVESIRRWWKTSGGQRYPNASELLITAELWRQQWISDAAVEIGTTTVGR